MGGTGSRHCFLGFSSWFEFILPHISTYLVPSLLMHHVTYLIIPIPLGGTITILTGQAREQRGLGNFPELHS